MSFWQTARAPLTPECSLSNLNLLVWVDENGLIVALIFYSVLTLSLINWLNSIPKMKSSELRSFRAFRETRVNVCSLFIQDTVMVTQISFMEEKNNHRVSISILVIIYAVQACTCFAWECLSKFYEHSHSYEHMYAVQACSGPSLSPFVLVA